MNIFDIALNKKTKDQFSQAGQQFKKALSPVVSMGKSFVPQTQQSFQSAMSALKTAGSNIINPVKQEFDYQSSVQKSIDPYRSKLGSLGITAQSLDSMGLSDEEKQAVKDLYSEIGVEIPGLTQQKVQSKDILKNANERKGFMQNVGGSLTDFFGGAVSEVPAIAGNLASSIGKASEYNPMVMLNQAIDAGFSDKTYEQIRAEQVAQNQKYSELGQKGKSLIQQYGQFDPTTTSAKLGEVATDIGASLVGPNKVGFLKKGSEILGAGKKLAMGAKIGDIALEGGLAGAKYDIGTKGTITPESVTIGALGNVGVQGALKGAKSIYKGLTIPKVSIPSDIPKAQQDALKILSPESFSQKELTDLKLAGKIKTGQGITGKKNTYIPDKFEVEVAKTASPYLKKGVPTSENISILKTAIKDEGNALENAIAQQNPIIPKQRVASHIKKVLTQVMDDPEMVGDNARIAQNLLNKYKAMVNEEGGTALGILNARKRFDSYIKSVKPKAFDSPTGRAYDTAVKTIRDSANELLDSLVLNKSAKESLKKQHMLYKAREMLSTKKDITTFGKILESPLTRGIAGGAVGGAGVGIVSNF